MFMRPFYNDLNYQVYSNFSSEVIAKKLHRNQTIPSLLSTSDIAITLVSYQNVMKVFQNGSSDFPRICGSENIAQPCFYAASFGGEYQLK